MKKLRTALRLEPSEFSAEAIEGELLDGKVSGDISLRKATEGLNLKARLSLQNVDARAFLGSTAVRSAGGSDCKLMWKARG